MIDIALLAGTVVGKLLVPVFKAGWDRVFDAAADEVGEQVADETKGIVSSVWKRLRHKLSGDEGTVVLSSFEKRPEATAPLLQELLTDLLQRDPAFADELSGLVSRRPGGGAMDGAQVIAHTVNQITVHGGVQGGAVVAGQIFGAVSPGAPGGQQAAATTSPARGDAPSGP